MPDLNPAPIQAYVFGKLTLDERVDLMRRALDEETLFEELVEADAHRELLANPAFRARLLRILEEREMNRWWQRLRRWVVRPVSRLALAGALVATAAVIVWRGAGRPTERGPFVPAGVVTNPATDLATYFRLPLTHARGAELVLNRTTFAPGGVIRASLRLPAPAAVFVLRETRGLGRIVFPENLGAPADLPAGETSFVFDPVVPTMPVTARLTVRLRILTLPAGSDIRSQVVDWPHQRDYAIAEAAYDVVP